MLRFVLAVLVCFLASVPLGQAAVRQIDVEPRTSELRPFSVRASSVNTVPSWTTLGDQASGLYGSSVQPAGDVNGDGYSDLLVGAPLYDHGETDEGRAYLYLGGAGGYSSTPAWVAEDNLSGSQFGAQVEPAGDVNGDGYADVIVSAYTFANTTGRVYGYYGSASGLHTAPDWIVTGPQYGGQFGIALATAGDVNGDGYDDVVVGEPYHSQSGLTWTGMVHVYFGSATGLSTAEAESLSTGQAATVLGISVATAGDVNGDGYADVIAGATTLGRAYVYYGSPGGLQSPTILSGPRDFGAAVAGAGDVDGDGYSDVIVGTPATNYASAPGLASVFRGSAGGIQASPSRQITRNRNGDQLGISVATAGDLNGDGLADIAIGAPAVNNATGEVDVYLSPGIAPFALPDSVTIAGDQSGCHFGCCVATAGDADGDGFSDLVAGANSFNAGGGGEGRVTLYRGALSLPNPNHIYGVGTGWGSSEPYRLSTGDVNGDGFTDMLQGDPLVNGSAGQVNLFLGGRDGYVTSAAVWNGGQPGARSAEVAVVGDVNGDGYEDALIGSPTYASGGRVRGRADLYYGGPSGAGLAAAWSAVGSDADSAFASAVAGVGDLNGDGYADIAVGDSLFRSAGRLTGAVDIYYGSAAGPSATPSWSAVGMRAGESFGAAVAGAGDVNRDGFADVVIGAPSYGDLAGQGRVYLFMGSASGLASSPALVDSLNVTQGYFGQSVATAGDVNGDGYSDVLATGAYAGRFLDPTPGAVQFYVGGPSPPYLTPNTLYYGVAELDGRPGPLAVAGGDLDGDGLGDVVVGAPGANDSFGHLTIWGWSGFYAIRRLSQSIAGDFRNQLGRTVAQCGDVNGDGFRDLLFTQFPLGGTMSWAFEAEGGALSGMDREARQARADGSAPIALMGATPDLASFGLRVRGRSAGGRARVRMEWQDAALGDAWSAPAQGSYALTGSPNAVGSYADLDKILSDATQPRPYLWRLRVASHSPYFPHTPWLSPPGNAPQEADLRLRSAVTAVAAGGTSTSGGLSLAPSTNPARGGFQFRFTLDRAARVRLAIYDASGRPVATLAEGTQESGQHAVAWNGEESSGQRARAGVYFARLEAAGRSVVAKIVLLD